jgi:hypothetical protein
MRPMAHAWEPSPMSDAGASLLVTLSRRHVKLH